jgi:formylglycine-generating enzyme required for sulfatase activity
MLLVDGIHCPFVAHRCDRFLSEPDGACKNFVPEVICEGRLQRRRFCIDTYEYPNLENVRPAVRVTFRDAEAGCAVEGKRLCTTDEWEFACEGTQMWPYPYGVERNAEACNIDRPEPTPSAPGVAADPRRISEEVARLDQRAASGDKAECVSPFGVRDMTGNVAEWTLNPNGKPADKPYRSALEGGGWGVSPARCRGMTTEPESTASHDVGFRCCADAPKPPRPPGASPLPEATGPRKRKLVPP